jgi:hypothetical protein
VEFAVCEMDTVAIQSSCYPLPVSPIISMDLGNDGVAAKMGSRDENFRRERLRMLDANKSQMLVIAFHEFSHAITSCCTGGRVESISLDPHEGGVTHMRGGQQFITLPAGYLGSSLIGALLTFCGFNIVASKVASIVLGVCFLLTLWWARKDWLTIVTILLSVGLLVAFWFIEHGEALRFMVVCLSPLLHAGYLTNDVNSYSSASCLRSTVSGISVMTSSYGKSTPPTPAFSPSDTAARRSAGVLYGRSSPWCLWYAEFWLGWRRSSRVLSSKRRIARILFLQLKC